MQTSLSDIKAAQFAAGVAALLAACLAISKLSLYFISGSLVIALSAWDSSIDVFISFINRKIIQFARQTADSNHPYGHGKAEVITALGQGALISGGSLIILSSSCQNLYKVFQGEFEPIVETWGTIFFFVAAAFLSFGITSWLKHHGKRFNSPALTADALHYRGDVVSNLGSAISLALIIISHQSWLDPLIAALFSLYICWNGFRLMRSSINDLMDHEVPENIKIKALAIITNANPSILDVHNFRSRSSGSYYFFDFHVTLPEELPFQEVHHIIQSIEEKLHDEFHTDAVVRADPHSLTQREPKVILFSR
ncbi:MAG: cation diffusion facilitator family transporter [Chlamydiales bacterium]|nr:cation diffusion facilitator family transporter [Chlamydiales bacterium]